MRPGALAFGLVWAIVMAGCADGGAPSSKASTASTSAAAPTLSDETGSLTGRVVDDEISPIVGADVGLTGASGVAPTKTDTEGRYTFNGLSPATYNVFVQQLGFQSDSRTVTVRPGEVAFANITLVAIPVSVVRRETYETNTYFEAGAGVSVVGSYYANQSGDTLRDIYYNVKPDVVGAVTGMKWQAAPGTAKRMYVELWVAEKSCAASTLCVRLNRTQGLSPLIVRSDSFQDHAEGKKMVQVNPAVGLNYCYTSAAPTNVNDCVANPDTFAQVIFQQRIKLYTTVFFAGPAPEGFSPLPP